MLQMCIDALVQALLYYSASMAFAFDRIGRGAINVAIGDVGSLACAVGFAALSLSGHPREVTVDVSLFLCVAGAAAALSVILSCIYSVEHNGRKLNRVDRVLRTVCMSLVLSGLTAYVIERRGLPRLSLPLRPFSIHEEAVLTSLQLTQLAIVSIPIVLMTIILRIGKHRSAFTVQSSNRVLAHSLGVPLARSNQLFVAIGAVGIGSAALSTSITSGSLEALGLQLTLTGYLVSTCARRKPVQIAFIGGALAVLEAFLIHSTRVGVPAEYVPSYWISTLALLPLLVVLSVRRHLELLE